MWSTFWEIIEIQNEHQFILVMSFQFKVNVSVNSKHDNPSLDNCFTYCLHYQRLGRNEKLTDVSVSYFFLLVIISSYSVTHVYKLQMQLC